eukprot:g7685.t1
MVARAAEQSGGTGRALPPVDKWNPPFCGDLDMEIRADGTWFYLGTPIGRAPLVRLFSTVLRKDGDGKTYLVTPVEKVGIRVEDAPFLAVEMQVFMREGVPVISFRTNVGDVVEADRDHPLRFQMVGDERQLKPYVLVRGRLEALLSRPVMYELVEQGEVVEIDGVDMFAVILTQRTATLRKHSGQIAFPGGAVDAEDGSPEQAALREALEEIGLDPSYVEPLARLPDYYAGTGFRITPVLAVESWFQDPVLQSILALLNSEGGEARVAGGAVRNTLMGLPVADVDIATTLRPEPVLERAAAAGLKCVPTGLEHGTVTLVADGRGFEVTTLRRDVETNGRHAVVEFGTDWQADAERRDLTINALYADKHGEVIDLVGGLADIESRTIRFIGDAAQRIAEDHLRILRFFRFFAYYGSGRPDAEGLRACARAKEKIAALSAERVWGETRKLLKAPDPSRALLWMRQVGVLTQILPETEKWGIDAIHGLVAAEAALNWEPDPVLRLAATVPPDESRLEGLAKRLRLSNSDALALKLWAQTPLPPDEVTDVGFTRILYRHGKRGMITRMKLALASARTAADGDPVAMRRTARFSQLLRAAESYERPVMPLSGADVVAAGIPAGKAVGEALKELEEFWISRNFLPGRSDLAARLTEIVAQLRQS